MLLTTLAAPLLMLGAPIRPLLRGLPSGARRSIVRPIAGSHWARGLMHFLRHPLVAVGIYVGGLYLWTGRRSMTLRSRTPPSMVSSTRTSSSARCSSGSEQYGR